MKDASHIVQRLALDYVLRGGVDYSNFGFRRRAEFTDIRINVRAVDLLLVSGESQVTGAASGNSIDMVALRFRVLLPTDY